MVLPLLKLGTLALRTACKPIATRLKTQAGRHPKFRQFIVDIAQVNHRFTTTMQRRIYGHATDVEIRPLNEEKAVQAAADLLGEFFIFTVAGAAVIFEWQRGVRSEARKEELRRQQLEELRQKIAAGDVRVEELAREVALLKERLAEQQPKGKGLSGVLHFRNGQSTADTNLKTPPVQSVL